MLCNVRTRRQNARPAFHEWMGMFSSKRNNHHCRFNSRSATTLPLHGWPFQETSTSRASAALPEFSQKVWNWRWSDIQGLPWSDSHIAASRMSERLHVGNLGAEKSLVSKTPETVLWPGISVVVINAVKACDIFQKHTPAQQKEPLQSHDIPSRPIS